MQADEKKEFFLFLTGLPLSVKSQFLLIFFSFVPYIILLFFFSNTWYGEIYLIPILVTLAILRFVLIYIDNRNIKPIVYENKKFYFPQNLFRTRKEKELNLSEISNVEVREMCSGDNCTNWKLIIKDSNNNNISISKFQANIDYIIALLEKSGMILDYKKSHMKIVAAMLTALVMFGIIYYIYMFLS